MANFSDIISSFFYYLGISILIFLLIEIFLSIFVFLKNKLFYKLVARKDFISKKYHLYLNWIENLNEPMFKYIPVGIRIFNDNNRLLGEIVKNNSRGFRTHEFSKKREEELRIILLGGSAAWGMGSSSNDTNISGHLEKIINTDKKLLGTKTNAKVFNLSQCTGTITQDILSLIFNLKEIEPDVVISYVGWNELVTNYRLDKKILSKYNFFYLGEMDNWEPTHLPKIRKRVIKNLLKNYFLENSKLFSFILGYKTISKTHPLDKIDVTDKISKNLKLNSSVVINNFNIIKNISKGFNFKIIHFLQPNLYRKSFLSSSESKILELYNEHRPVHGGKKIANFLKNTNIYEFVCDESSKKYLNVINLLDIFKEEKQSVYYTLVHLNDLGYKLVAERIYKNLLANR